MKDFNLKYTPTVVKAKMPKVLSAHDGGGSKFHHRIVFMDFAMYVVYTVRKYSTKWA
jgi:hypothetical protein